jgi:hypothetical protein
MMLAVSRFSEKMRLLTHGSRATGAIERPSGIIDPMEIRPAEWLREGCSVLAPNLESHGFRLGQQKVGNGSGGHFAEVRWTRGEQYLELHVRYSLGLVTYGWDGESFRHADYMSWRQVRGQYPGYGTDPIDGFRHLAADLNGAAAPLLTMTKTEFVEVASAIHALPPPGLP